MGARLGLLGASLAGGLGLLAALHAPRACADGAAVPSPLEPPSVTRTVVNYAVPEIALVRDDGRAVSLHDELDDGRPVVLNFIYTTCPGICSLASHVFSELQRRLGSESDRVHLVSISIDPEEDTPARLREYARRYSAGPGWRYYTGTAGASIAAQRVFDVYRGDKMGHTPVTLLRLTPGAPWVRFDGYATVDLVIKELHGQGEATACFIRP